MSGGIVQLVATGDQDKWLTGSPEVSFYRSSFRRYTHFANALERQVIQGNPQPGGISTIRFEKKGDLITYGYFVAHDPNGAMIATPEWNKVIDKVELLIGGQVIDSQDFAYMTEIEPVTGAQTFNQRLLNQNQNTGITNQKNLFFPLKFFFNKDWSSALPLVALQYHDVELRITWSAKMVEAATAAYQKPKVLSAPYTYKDFQYVFYTNFVYLDQSERDFFAKAEHDMLITQVQRVPVSSSPIQEIALAHPVKFIAFKAQSYRFIYKTAGGAAGEGSLAAKPYSLKTQVNGVDVGDYRHLPHFTDIAQYYHTQFAYAVATRTDADLDNSIAKVGIIPFCLDTTKLQPTGTLNFSRIDTYRILCPSAINLTNITGNSSYFYAVNYNVLRIKNGMGAVLYAN
jgi:hypothetical protein